MQTKTTMTRQFVQKKNEKEKSNVIFDDTLEYQLYLHLQSVLEKNERILDIYS